MQLGIGNTTAAAAVLAAVAGLSPDEACGRGTGVDDAGLETKRSAVAAALEANAALVASGPLGVLQAVGACGQLPPCSRVKPCSAPLGTCRV
jgi:nicotinate-nucleotide--dimethylbenzimidazole phosphoribosyltransferase